MSAHAGSEGQLPESHRRKRRAINCEECRRSKLRCDRQHPCGACKRRKRAGSCTYELPPSSHVSANLNRTPVTTSSTTALGSVLVPQPEFAISGTTRAPPDTDWGTVLERPAPEHDDNDALSSLLVNPPVPLQEIIKSLPPKPCCDYLISHFFKTIFPLFPILHGPTFQKEYAAFMQRLHNVDLSWLALLFSLCSLVLNTVNENEPRLAPLWSSAPNAQAPATVSLSRRLLRTAMTCLLQDGFLIRHKFSTFEALLMVIYNLSHNESVDQGWALLGMALNIGIALRCNVDLNSSPIETERRRRCWAGLLTLHTYQGMLFRDVDMAYLLNIKAVPPADVNDADITENGILQSSSRSSKRTQMSVMMAKLRLFQLSAQICRHISGPLRLDQRSLQELDAAIAEEQKQWDSTYMVDGSPDILDSNSYAFWCVLQTYAHHLYLLLHRPFHHPKASCYLPTSRERCISSSTALISIHRQLYEAPLLRDYAWLLSGVTSLKALHAAVALNSCLQDLPSAVDPGYDLQHYRKEIESLVIRLQDLSSRSNICLRAYQILRHLQ